MNKKLEDSQSSNVTPTGSKSDEQKLIESVQNGNQTAFGKLIRIHQKRLFRFIYGLVNSFDIAEDIVQETFVKAFQKIETFKTGFAFLKENPKTLVFGVASYMIFATVLISTMNIFPIYVKNHLHAPANTYAMSEMFYTLGALISSVAIHTIFRNVSKSLAIILLTFITGALYITLASTAIPMLFFIMSLVLGITNAGTRILRMTHLFTVIPNQVFGRAGSIFFISNILFRLAFLSIFTIPFFHLSNNIIYSFVIFMVFLIIAGCILIWNDRRKI